MIRKSIEAGTIVFHEVHGFGTFHEWWVINNNFAVITFNDDPDFCLVLREELTEIEDEGKV